MNGACSEPQMVHKESTVPYGEVEGFSTLLGYKTSNAGCCKVSELQRILTFWLTFNRGRT